MRKITAILLAMMLTFTMVPAFAAETQSRLDQVAETYNPSEMEVYVFIHGEEKPLELHGYYDETGNLMVPLREAAESIGYEVNWNGETQSIVVTGGTFYTEITIGLNSYYFARVASFPLESEPMLVNGTTYVPLSFFTDVVRTSAYILEDGNLMVNSPVVNYVYHFYDDEDGFEFGFADIPLDYLTSATYDIDMGYSEIPVEGSKEMGLYLDGDNHSDDIFLYITKELDGLASNQVYKYDVNFDLATNVPGGMFGIGGSPGESVYVKAGVSTEKPVVIEDGQYYRLNNVDKSNQSQSGKDLIVVTNVSKTDGSEDDGYAYKDVDGSGYFTSDENGKAHLTIGFDSGFEGATKLYIDNVKLDVYEAPEEFTTVGTIQ